MNYLEYFGEFVYVLVVMGILSPVPLVLFIWIHRRLKATEAQLTNVVPYWQAIQAKLIVDLTHPHPGAERVDELLQILKADPLYKMSPEDRTELLEGLAKRAAGADPKISEEEQRKARIFPLVMEEVQREAANPKPITALQLIGVKQEEDVHAPK